MVSSHYPLWLHYSRRCGYDELTCFCGSAQRRIQPQSVGDVIYALHSDNTKELYYRDRIPGLKLTPRLKFTPSILIRELSEELPFCSKIWLTHFCKFPSNVHLQLVSSQRNTNVCKQFPDSCSLADANLFLRNRHSRARFVWIWERTRWTSHHSTGSHDIRW